MIMCKSIFEDLKSLSSKLYSLSYITNVFIFGSMVKGMYNEDSDIDLLIIGSQPKTIQVLMNLDKLCEGYSREVDIIYYSEEEFKQCLDGGNLFLKDLESYCLDLKEVISNV